MQDQRQRMEMIDRLVTDGTKLGIGHLYAEDEQSDGRHVRIRGRDLLNFSSCGYLGLELDPRLIEGGIDALRQHGVEMASSRAYISSPLYTEFEALVEEIFQAHVVVASTTTLGHLAAIPALVDQDDAIVMDHQVHASVQMACSLAKGTGTHVEIVRHNALDRLERRVAYLSRRHRQVWYMADGIYSMFGDRAPNAEILEMLDRHPQMRYYVDDAHGMSWCGPRGAGSVLEEVSLHPRMILTTGLGKGFGTGGGLILLPDAEQKRRIRSCGPTLIFSGPLQNPILGAAIASAKIHLSDEIETLQCELVERIEFCSSLLTDFGLPVITPPNTPIGFIGTGPTRACHSLSARLLEEGIYTNPAFFPGTAAHHSGGRFLLTRHHKFEDIEALAAAMEKHWEPAIRDGGTTPEKVWLAFGLEPPVARLDKYEVAKEPGLYLEVTDTIDKLDHEEWDRMLGDRGCVGSQAVSLYERAFGPDESQENRWTFRYYIVRDADGEAVLATCFTRSLWKADMLSSSKVSEKVEELRTEDPLHLTQWVFCMGNMLSEGDHLWLRDSADSETSRLAIRQLLDAVRDDSRVLNCAVTILRDIPEDATDLAALYEGEGLFRADSPVSLVLDDIYVDDEELISRLGPKHRRHQLKDVQPFNDSYEVEVVGLKGRPLAPNEAEHLYSLYRNVKSSSLGLNTFELPKNLLAMIAEAPGWEILVFRDAEMPSAAPVGFGACYAQKSTYVPLFMGLDYKYVQEKGLYRQQLRHAVIRARERGCRRVLFGYEASLEKRRFGAHEESSSMFVEARDMYDSDVLCQIASGSK